MNFMKLIKLQALLPKYTISCTNNQIISSAVQHTETAINHLLRRREVVVHQQNQGQQQEQGYPPFIGVHSFGPGQINNVRMLYNTPECHIDITADFETETGFNVLVPLPRPPVPTTPSNIYSGNLRWDLPKSIVFRTDAIIDNQRQHFTAVIDATLFTSKCGTVHVTGSKPLNYESPITAQITVHGSFDCFFGSKKSQQLPVEQTNLKSSIPFPIQQNESKFSENKIDLVEPSLLGENPSLLGVNPSLLGGNPSLLGRNIVRQTISSVFCEITINIIRNEMFIVSIVLTAIKVLVIQKKIIDKKNGKSEKKDKYFLIFKLPSLESFCNAFSGMMMVQVFYPYSAQGMQFLFGNILKIIIEKPQIYSACCFICKVPGPKAFLQVSNTLTTYCGSALMSAAVLKLFEFLLNGGIAIIITLVTRDKDLNGELRNKSEKERKIEFEDVIDTTYA